MKKIIILFIFFVATQAFAQNNGITYQAIILNPKGEQLPGVNNLNSPLVNKDICMVFKFIDEFSNVEYQESIQTKTDQFGMVNLIIGSGTQTAGYALSFKDVFWSSLKKSLIVGINTDGNCATYIEISNQDFSYVPMAFSSINAENVTGVVSIENGGTNAITLVGAKTNLQINNVDNTSDENKPISVATQSVLNLKEDLLNKSINIITDGSSDTKYPTVKSVKTYVDANSATSSIALTAEISRATAAETANATAIATETTNRTAADATLTTNLATEISTARVAEFVNATAIATETTNRTSADATLTANLATEVSTARVAEFVNATAIATETTNRTSADATLTANLATEVTNRTTSDTLKENLANKSTNVTTDGASDTKYPTVKSVKTYVDANSVTSSTALTAEFSRATTAESVNAAAIATEATNRTSADALKEDLANKSTDVTIDGASDIKYPTVKSVKTYVDANSATSSTALTEEISRATTAESTNATAIATEITIRTSTAATFATNLALKANIASPTFTGTVSGITKAMVGLGNVDNTTDVNKPVSIATQTAIDLKVDKVSGKGLSSEDFSSADKTKLAAITGSNTGDQDLSGLATNTNLALKANIASPTFTGTVSGITKAMVGLTNVDNTTDANKPVSTATQTAIDLKANIASPTFTGTVSGITKSMVGLANVDNTTDADKPISTVTQTAIDLKVDKVSGKGLSTEDFSSAEKTKLAAITGSNTGDQDLNGLATNTNLALKANIASPTFTGTVSGITKAMVSLANVDNTTDAGKPVSTAAQTALNLKANLASPTFTGTPLAPTAAAGTNNTQLATTAFVKTAVLSAIIELTDEFSASVGQTDFTLAQTPSVNSKVKMFVNGIRISNTGYNWTGTTLTYVSANNGGYELSLNDRIQFDYYTAEIVVVLPD